jgi:hypothetical protein
MSLANDEKSSSQRLCRPNVSCDWIFYGARLPQYHFLTRIYTCDLFSDGKRTPLFDRLGSRVGSGQSGCKLQTLLELAARFPHIAWLACSRSK